MTRPQRFEQVEQLFFAALDVPKEKREAFLNERCAADPELRADVARLLRHQSSHGSLLDRPLPVPDDLAGQLAAAPDSARQAWGPLEIRARLGTNKLGEVYRAYDRALQREVALNLLAREYAGTRGDHILDDLRRLARVRNPHVVVVHGVAVHDGRPGWWSDLPGGRSLECWLDTRDPLDAGEAIAIGIDLCRALAALQRAGVVHRDLKTARIMRENNGRLVLMESEVLVPHGTNPDASVDVFALGALLQALVEPRGDSHPGDRKPLRTARPDLPAAFIAIVERALATDPAERYASAEEVEAALAAAREESDPARGHATHGRGRNSWWVMAWVVIVALAMLALAWGLWALV